MEFSMQLDTLWILFCAVLVFFMRAGFAMVETGFTRVKNAGNIIMKNIMDFACGSLVFLAIGYGLLYGVSKGGWIGSFDFFAQNTYNTGAIPKAAHIIFSTMFCATATTIVSGAMAERTKFKSYLIYSIIISALVYPISASWVWGGGWLSEITIGNAAGFIDNAGSALIHMVGGIAALIGAACIGPRIGKFGKDKKARGIPGHSITLGALGVFILWFGWFGFNGMSSYGISTADKVTEVSNIFLTTNAAAVAAAVTAMIITWIRYGKPDVSMTLNGILSGLVAITAGCAKLDLWAACIVGGLAGIIVVFSVEFIEKKLKIDDPVGAFSVHGVNGAFGALAVGLFSRDTGLFTTGEWGQFLIQLIGVLVIAVWVTAAMGIVFLVLKHTIGLRVGQKEEEIGLDISENGLQSEYAGLMPSTVISFDQTSYGYEDEKQKRKSVQIKAGDVSLMEEGIREKLKGTKLTKIVVLTKQSKFEELKDAMNEIGITGMTVTQVLGCGMQKGRMEYYRGAPVETMQLLPKIQVDIVVAKVPVKTVVEKVKEVLYSGHIGDGKIFVYDVENAIKVRTGEEGYFAMQGMDE